MYNVVVVAAAAPCAVASEVLRARDHAPVALQSAHLCGGHGGPKHRVLARALEDPSPAGIAGDIDHGRGRPVDPGGARLAARDALRALGGLRVPRRGEGDRGGEDGAEPVDDVEAVNQRDAPAPALDGHPLQAVGLGRVLDEQERAGPTPLKRGLHHPGLLREDAVLLGDGVAVDPLGRFGRETEVEVLRQLACFLFQRESAEQIIYPRVDGQERALVSELRHGLGLLWGWGR